MEGCRWRMLTYLLRAGPDTAALEDLETNLGVGQLHSQPVLYPGTVESPHSRSPPYGVSVLPDLQLRALMPLIELEASHLVLPTCHLGHKKVGVSSISARACQAHYTPSELPSVSLLGLLAETTVLAQDHLTHKQVDSKTVTIHTCARHFVDILPKESRKKMKGAVS